MTVCLINWTRPVQVGNPDSYFSEKFTIPAKQEFFNLGKSLYPEVKTYAARPTTKYHAGDDDNEPYMETIVNGKVVTLPIPNIAGMESETLTREDAYVPDVLVNARNINGEVKAATVWLDGQQIGVEVIDADVMAEFLPTFKIATHSVTGDVRGRCVVCDYSVTYFEVATKRGVRVEPPDANMEAFTAMLLLHTQQAHSSLNKDDVCKHGLRNYVSNKLSRATGVRFTASFCPLGTQKNACDPVWHND